MSSLTSMSAEEISKLLDEYGIKHGPVVGSTRSLYERKLSEAMSQAKRVKPTEDKTFYREEEEEVTYVYRTPMKGVEAGDSSGAYMRSRPNLPETNFEQKSSYSSYSTTTPGYSANDFANRSYTYETPSTYKYTHLKSTPVKSAQETPAPPKSSRLVSVWVQIILFLAVAVFFYMVFASMETNEPFKGVE